MIERYLAELARLLPRRLWGADRVLEEVETHLHEAAAASSEEEAVARFGPAAAVARGYVARQAGWIAAVMLLLVAAGPILSYPIIENTLPPAPWPGDRPPDYLHWKQDAVVQLFLGGAALTLAGLALLQRRRGLAVAALGVAAVALVGMGVLGVILSVQWAGAVPGTPWWTIALWVANLGGAVVGAGLAARALALR